MKDKSVSAAYMLFIDANILVQDFWLKGYIWQYLIKREFLGHKLIIPKIALDEATANIIRRANDLLKRMLESGNTNRLTTQYQHLFNRKKVGKESAEDLGQRYRRHVTRMVKKHGGSVIDPPEVSIDVLIQRSIERQKPFNQGDKGFRDTLIWFNVLDTLRNYQRVSFVSANTTDYADKDSLHSELENDIAPILPEGIKFLYFKNLHEFVAYMDKGGEATALVLRDALMSTGYKGFQLDVWIEENIHDLLEGKELDEVNWTSLPYSAENPILTELEEIIGFEIHNQHALESDRVELFCDLAIVGVFQCSIAFADWKKVVSRRQVVWVDDTDEIWTDIGVRSIGTFLLRLVFDLNQVAIVDRDIEPVHHDINQAVSFLREVSDLEKLE